MIHKPDHLLPGSKTQALKLMLDYERVSVFRRTYEIIRKVYRKAKSKVLHKNQTLVRDE